MLKQYLFLMLFAGILSVNIDSVFSAEENTSEVIIRCPVTRDTGISSAEGETAGNNGVAEKLKLKGTQEYLLFDIDPKPLKGKIITAATLHLYAEGVRGSGCGVRGDDVPLARVGISTLASQWTEGDVRRYRSQVGASCYEQAEYRKRNWAYRGSTLMDAVFGKGHTIWSFGVRGQGSEVRGNAPRLSPLTSHLSPDIVSARLAGLSYGFCVCDEVGSIWSFKNGEFKFDYFPNHFFYSRESGDKSPYLEVCVQGSDSVAPEAIRSLQIDTAGFPEGEALLRWHTPKDTGGGKTLGFNISFRRRNSEKDKDMPRYLIPMAGNSGEEVKMHIQDMGFAVGEEIVLSIRAVDSAGNAGQPFTKTVRLSQGYELPDINMIDVSPFPPRTALPQVGGIKVSVVDILDKIEPGTGKMIPPREDGYKGGNHLFSAEKKIIRLQAARNETIGFQVILEGIMTPQNINLSCKFDQSPNLLPKFYQFARTAVLDKNKKPVSMLPDPLIPLKPCNQFSILNSQFSILNSFLCEIYVPHETSPGEKKGKLILSEGKEQLELDIDLTVWNFTLPDKLSFVPEMNVYGTVSPYKNYDYYLLAHEHRTCINRLSYGWNGVPEFAPEWKGDHFDWTEWDEKVGPLLDGSAFVDLPRKNEPVDIFYLPFSENWPVSLANHYSPSYWADEAFSESYQTEMKKAFAAFASHCEEKNWRDTAFQFYLNNKITYRKSFPQSSAPWMFDEPVNTQDFWALRWYGLLWRSAVDPIAKNTRMWYRTDISYSQFGRNLLWGIADIEYLGANNAQKTRMKHDEQILSVPSHFAEYGTANRIEDPNTQPVLWCLSAWAKGAVGVMPWQTLGGPDCWRIAEQTALFYPHPDGPKPSVRLKAFTRGQQDVEYLTLLCDVFQIPRFAAAKWLKTFIPSEGKVCRTFADDAGTAFFYKKDDEKGDAGDLWEMRYRVGKMLSDKAPPYKREIVNLRIHRDNHQNRPDLLKKISLSSDVEPYKPNCDKPPFGVMK